MYSLWARESKIRYVIASNVTMYGLYSLNSMRKFGSKETSESMQYTVQILRIGQKFHTALQVAVTDLSPC